MSAANCKVKESIKRLVACACIGLLLQAAAPALAEDPGAFYKGIQAFRDRQFDTAVSYFEQAAAQGDSEAQFLLGRMHYDGSSLPVDYVAAYQWFAIAAETGLPVAVRYRDGLAERMTPAEVIEGARRAAEWVSRHPVAREPEMPRNRP